MKHLQHDHRFMVQIVSSAIWNAPPPAGLIRLLHRTNRASTLTLKSKEKMLRLFRVRTCLCVVQALLGDGRRGEPGRVEGAGALPGGSRFPAAEATRKHISEYLTTSESL